LSARQSTAFPGPVDEAFRDAEFPCLVCGTGLEVRLSRKEKPYIVCDSCGIQVFFRGKTGIHRFRELLETRTLIVGKESLTDKALVLYNHNKQLRGRRKKLADGRKLLSTDEALEAAIRAVDNEIERVQGELEKLGPRED
jgi:DNA-directed RNA polymerase subunit RPC12/RpoP